MYNEMILVSYAEYERLKSFEEKYIALKKKHIESTGQKQGPNNQVGMGQEQELEKTILSHENANSNDLKAQTIMEPLTTPMAIKDVEGPAPNAVTKEPKKRKRGKRKEKEACPTNWWLIGKPTYKH